MLESTAVVAAEQEVKNARQMLESVSMETDDNGLAVSAVTVLELTPGVTGTITELGLNGQVISTATEALSAGTLDSLATGVGWAKFGWDAATFLTGYFTKCQ